MLVSDHNFLECLLGDLTVLRSFPVPPHFPRGRAEAGAGQGRLQSPLRNSICFLVSLPVPPDHGMGLSRALSLSAPLRFRYLDLKYFWLFHLCLFNK